MNYKIIDDAIPQGTGHYIFNMLCKRNIWNLWLPSDSTKPMSEGSEPMHPGCKLFDEGESSGVDMLTEGFLISTFLNIMYNNNLHFLELDRILCNANYSNTVLDHHKDVWEDGYETMVLFVTPTLQNSYCGIMIDKEYVDYSFCRAVIFNSQVRHTAICPQEQITFPRLSIGFMYKV